MLSNISSNPQVRGRSSTNTQSLPRHRLSIMPSQNARRHVPSHTISYPWSSYMKPQAPEAFAAFIGLDWADAKHDICLQAAGSAYREILHLDHRPEVIDAWVQSLRTLFNVQLVALCP